MPFDTKNDDDYVLTSFSYSLSGISPDMPFDTKNDDDNVLTKFQFSYSLSSTSSHT